MKPCSEPLLEGYDSINENGDAFIDKSSIAYSANMPLKKTDCTTLKK